MSPDEIAAILGPVDPMLIAEIAQTGATQEELAQAWTWINADEALINEGRRCLPAASPNSSLCWSRPTTMRTAESHPVLLQPEFAAHRAEIGGSDQILVGDGDPEQLAVELRLPEGEELVELGKARGEIVVLPDVFLQDRGMVGQAVENAGGGQSIARDLAGEVR